MEDSGRISGVGQFFEGWTTINGPGTGPPRESGLSHSKPSSKIFPARSVIVVLIGWFRITPIAPSSLCSSIRITLRVKMGARSWGVAIRR